MRTNIHTAKKICLNRTQNSILNDKRVRKTYFVGRLTKDHFQTGGWMRRPRGHTSRDLCISASGVNTTQQGENASEIAGLAEIATR